MKTTVYLIRHGAVPDEHAGRYYGQTDIPLSRDGVSQISAMAEHLRKDMSSDPGAVYSSDLVRALNSAQIIAAAFGLQPIAAPQLRERHFGRWEGLTFDEIRIRHPKDFGRWLGDPTGFKPPGGENAGEIRQRVMPFFNEVVQRHPGRQIAVVAHGGVNRIILCTLLRIPLEHLFSIGQDYGALNILELGDDFTRVRAINHTAVPKE